MVDIFKMTTNDLANWAKNTAPGQDGCDINPADAKKLAKKITKEGISGPQLSNLGEAGIKNLFPRGWKPAVVAELAKTILATKEEEINRNVPTGQGQGAAVPQRFNINVGGVGGGANKQFTVDKDWTYQTFLEQLYESEKGHLPRDRRERERIIKDFNVVGTKLPPPNEYKTKTLKQLQWIPGHSIHATYTAQGGIILFFVYSLKKLCNYCAVQGFYHN